MRSKIWGLWTTGFVLAIGLGVVFAQSSKPVSVDSSEPVTVDADKIIPAGPLESEMVDEGRIVPIPAGASFRPYVVGVGESSVSAAANTTGSVVYSNKLGNGIFRKSGSEDGKVVDEAVN